MHAVHWEMAVHDWKHTHAEDTARTHETTARQKRAMAGCCCEEAEEKVAAAKLQTEARVRRGEHVRADAFDEQ